jgi:hypothetical protein
VNERREGGLGRKCVDCRIVMMYCCSDGGSGRAEMLHYRISLQGGIGVSGEGCPLGERNNGRWEGVQC